MSALVDKVYTLSNLIEFNESGLSIASFVDIKRALINRMRQLYGVDIDVSDASVDGQWITEIALLINNTFQAFNNLYADLNPAVAQGKALDLLASFSNISRKPASASICEITLTDTVAFSLSSSAEFIDKNGNIWQIDTSRSDLLPVMIGGSYEYSASNMSNGVTVPLICTVTGPISIPANTILSFVNVSTANSSVQISQPNAGVKGTIEESDAHLRARRNNSSANEAVTIAKGIQGILLSNANILDAYVINHIVDDANAATTKIYAHTVEVIVRTKFKSASSSDLNQFIASAVYNRLTPGIPTTYDQVTTNTTVDVEVANKNILRQVVKQIDNTSFIAVTTWAEAVPIKPDIAIWLHKLANCDKAAAAAAVIRAVSNYANNLGLLIDLDASMLLQEILHADPKFQGRATFWCAPNDIRLNDQPFTFKPSEEPSVSPISAQKYKTFYQYDDTCTYDQVDESYKNADGTIEINFPV